MAGLLSGKVLLSRLSHWLLTPLSCTGWPDWSRSCVPTTLSCPCACTGVTPGGSELPSAVDAASYGEPVVPAAPALPAVPADPALPVVPAVPFVPPAAPVPSAPAPPEVAPPLELQAVNPKASPRHTTPIEERTLVISKSSVVERRCRSWRG